MAVLLSANMFRPDKVGDILWYLDKMQGQIGIEVFPYFDDSDYEGRLKKIVPVLKDVPVTFHEPYRHSDHAAKKGTKEYDLTMRMEEKTAEYAALLHAKHVVLHHNNCRVPEDEAAREQMRRTACENVQETIALFEKAGVTALVENVGVHVLGNILYEEDAFQRLVGEKDYPVLIDIGHAHANGWNLAGDIAAMAQRIHAFHLHNNDGVHDSHQRIHNGTMDFDSVFSVIRARCPSADLILEYAPGVAADKEGVLADLREVVSRIS